nr:MAG TPA: NADH dehydrogenase [Caudoviricetes sp.]
MSLIVAGWRFRSAPRSLRGKTPPSLPLLSPCLIPSS